jgi:hypothetical protein
MCVLTPRSRAEPLLNRAPLIYSSHDNLHRPLEVVHPTMYSYADPSPSIAPFTELPPSRQRSNSDGSLLPLHSPVQQHMQVAYPPYSTASPTFSHSPSVQPHMQVAYPPYSTASPTYSHSPPIQPQMQVAYLPYSTTSSTFSHSPTISVAGSLDPTTGIFYRTPEHPRLRTAQACEKCRIRKAKVRTSIDPY